MPQHEFALKVGSVVSLSAVVYLPLALQRITSTEEDKFCDLLWGDPGDGLVELAKFINGGRFRVVDGHTTTPEELV